ncbi:MAG: ATP-binding cassette domain-containing protein, partial [Streptosporangiaceae bacterium]
MPSDWAQARPELVPAGPELAPGRPELLETRDLRVHYRAPRLGRGGVVTRAVDGVTLTLRQGTTLGLVGESGSGKTTLAKSLVRLEPVTSGEILFGGVDIAAMSERAFTPVRKRIQMVFQDSLNSLNPRFTLADTLTEPFIVHRLAPRAQLRDRVAELLLQVGLSPDMMDEQATHLSGGQRQRVSEGEPRVQGVQRVLEDHLDPLAHWREGPLAHRGDVHAAEQDLAAGHRLQPDQALG